jgi:hypothetical protein
MARSNKELKDKTSKTAHFLMKNRHETFKEVLHSPIQTLQIAKSHQSRTYYQNSQQSDLNATATQFPQFQMNNSQSKQREQCKTGTHRHYKFLHLKVRQKKRTKILSIDQNRAPSLFRPPSIHKKKNGTRSRRTTYPSPTADADTVH